MINSEWSKGFNTNGGVDNIVLYKSPYSSNVAFNSRQGKITGGIIQTEFEPPTLTVEAPSGSAVMVDRLNIEKTNPMPMEVKEQARPMTVEEAFRQKRKVEKYGVQGLKDSHLIHASSPIDRMEKESFSAEDGRALIIIILAIVAICIVGFTFGVLVPKIKFVHKVKMAEPKQQKVEERSEAF